MEENSTQNQINSNFGGESGPNSLKNKLLTFLRTGNLRFILGGVLILLVLLISVLAFTKKAPVTPGKVSPNAKDVLLVTVGDQKIYKSDVQKAAKEQYVSSAIDNNVLQVFLDLLIEQKILDIEASKLGITVTQSEIDNSIYSNTASSSAKSTNLNKFIKYSVLKDKIMAKQVKSVSAYVISYWIPPAPYPQEPVFSQQRIDSKKAFKEAKQKLKNNEKVSGVAEYIFDTYPSLQSILVVNGYNYNLTKDKLVFNKPRVYIYNKKEIDSSNNPAFFDALFGSNQGDIKLVAPVPEVDGSLVQIISVNKDGFISYDQFLESKKKDSLKIISQL